MWGECVDAVIFDAIVWPRAAAAAEQVRFVPPAQMFVAVGGRISGIGAGRSPCEIEAG